MNITFTLSGEFLKTVGLLLWYIGVMPLLTWATLILAFGLGHYVSWYGVEVTYMLLYGLFVTYALLRYQANRSGEGVTGVPEKGTTVAEGLHRGLMAQEQTRRG